jgi:perosamine synthetase
LSTPGTSSDVLAIHGGTPTRSTFLPYGRQQLEEADIEAVVEVLRSDWITTGPKVQEFEEAVAAFVDARYAVAFTSGTAALHGAAFAAGLEPGDQAITTPMTFAATANCVLYMGAEPVFADVSPDTLNIDPGHVAELINSKTKAILPVDYSGHPVELDRLLELAQQNNLVVIEDAAHALGASYKDRKIGSLSHMTVFSFHPVKHLTTGEGGMVTTDDPDLFNRLRTFRNHGIDQDARQRQDRSEGAWFYEMRDLGYNYRLSDIGCALGLSQIDRLPQNLARRREVAARYNQAFADVSGVITPTEYSDVNSAWHLYPIRLELDRFSVGRREIFDALRAENIGVNVHYIPVHLHPYYKQRFGYSGGEFPVAEQAYETLLSLPMFHSILDSDVEDVILAVNRVIGHYRNDH